MTTTSVDNLLMDLTRHGIQLEVHGDKLRYRPIDAMTPDFAERVKAHKPELLAILAGNTKPLTHAEREVQRFLRVCVPHTDGSGASDPAYTRTIKALANVPPYTGATVTGDTTSANAGEIEVLATDTPAANYNWVEHG